MLLKEIMTANVEVVPPGDTMEQAARLMEAKQIRRLLVMSRSEDLVGIVSLGDLASAAGGQGQPGEVLKKVSEPS